MEPARAAVRAAAEIEQANQEHFNKIAVDCSYDNHPFVERISRQITDKIKQAFQFDEESTILLDYACGTGQISRNLAPYTKKIIGVDISQGMVDYYNQRVYNQGIPQDQMQALCLHLTGPGADYTDLDGQKFDVIVCSQAYHHFPDIAAVTKTLASLLKPGTGKLFVADLMTYDTSIFKQSPASGHGHANHHSHEPHAPFQGPTVVRKGGFAESDIHSVFTAAGLVDWEFIQGAASAQMKEKHVQLFLAIGRRPE